MSQGGCVAGVPLIQGQPKPRLTVQILGAGPMKMGSTDASGRFEICNLEAGTYMVMITDMAEMMSGNIADMVPVQRSAVVADGETTEVDFAPPPGAVAVEGTIAGALGTMTTVSLRTAGSPAPEEIDPFDMQQQLELMELMGGTAVVREDGSFSMPEVPPGDYILEVFSMNFDLEHPDPEQFMETPAPVIRQEITIEPGVSPTLALKLPAATE